MEHRFSKQIDTVVHRMLIVIKKFYQQEHYRSERIIIKSKKDCVYLNILEAEDVIHEKVKEALNKKYYWYFGTL